MLAEDVMTSNVATVTPQTLIRDAIGIMVKHHISGLAVIDASGVLAGVVTEGDLLRRVELGTDPHRPGWLNVLRGPGLAAADYVRTRTLIVGDIMTPAPVCVRPRDSLEHVVAAMERHHIRRVLVVEDGRLAGVVSRQDLIRTLAGLIGDVVHTGRDDAAIQADILIEIKQQNWCGMSSIAVGVERGRVVLDGAAQTDAVRDAIRVVAERVPGVVTVENRIDVPDPMVMAMGA